MNRLRRQFGLLALLLGALLLRGFLPAGSMPGKGADGRAGIVLCSSQGSAGEAVAAARTAGMDCPFGFALSMVGLSSPPEVQRFGDPRHETPASVFPVHTAALARVPYLARGPPAALV